ncbi:hypothetical protein RND81_12G235400 [Saponaria officinalis]|uniref:Uncharacterized protein n=1 Tax=Saponaria officinalis TaxID=3572 RepID=A0AAW1HEE7_SAPOF
MFPNMKTIFFFLACLLLLSLEINWVEGEYQNCPYGTEEMERCTIGQCMSKCHDKVPRSTGKCIAIDTCCCITRPNFHHF